MTGVLTEEIFQENLEDLKSMLSDDYMDLGGVISSVRGLLPRGSGLTYLDLKPFNIRLIHELIAAGAQAGSITKDGFTPWPVSPQVAEERIIRFLDEHDSWPRFDEINDLAWMQMPQ